MKRKVIILMLVCVFIPLPPVLAAQGEGLDAGADAAFDFIDALVNDLCLELIRALVTGAWEGLFIPIFITAEAKTAFGLILGITLAGMFIKFIYMPLRS